MLLTEQVLRAQTVYNCWSHMMRKIERAGTSPILSDFMERT